MVSLLTDDGLSAECFTDCCIVDAPLTDCQQTSSEYAGTRSPDYTPSPTSVPTAAPTRAPTPPTPRPSAAPTSSPTTQMPTPAPTAAPTRAPTPPTPPPSAVPTSAPTATPTRSPDYTPPPTRPHLPHRHHRHYRVKSIRAPCHDNQSGLYRGRKCKWGDPKSCKKLGYSCTNTRGRGRRFVPLRKYCGEDYLRAGGQYRRQYYQVRKHCPLTCNTGKMCNFPCSSKPNGETPPCKDSKPQWCKGRSAYLRRKKTGLRGQDLMGSWCGRTGRGLINDIFAAGKRVCKKTCELCGEKLQPCPFTTTISPTPPAVEGGAGCRDPFTSDPGHLLFLLGLCPGMLLILQLCHRIVGLHLS